MTQRIIDSGFRNWTPSQLPDLQGKRYVITGANSGIGYEAAKMLAAAGANIVFACRSLPKAEKVMQLLAANMSGDVDLVELDLSKLSSVRNAANEIRNRYSQIDGLINNAGVMQTPQTTTVDGFDLQMAANHLGHFLWAALLLDLVEAASGRIVILSSLIHKANPLNLGDLMSEKDYSPTTAYGQSKLANLMFAFELDHRLKEANSTAICIACHPGYSSTGLQSSGPTGMFKLLYKVLNPLLAQAPDKGAIPTVLSAAGVEAKRGAYYGPQSMSEARGRVSDATVANHALDKKAWKQLWERSEQLVGHKWHISK